MIPSHKDTLPPCHIAVLASTVESSHVALDPGRTTAAKRGDLAELVLLDQAIGNETDPAALYQAALCYRASERLNDALGLLKVLEDRGQTRPLALLLRADIFSALIGNITRYRSIKRWLTRRRTCAMPRHPGSFNVATWIQR